MGVCACVCVCMRVAVSFCFRVSHDDDGYHRLWSSRNAYKSKDKAPPLLLYAILLYMSHGIAKRFDKGWTLVSSPKHPTHTVIGSPTVGWIRADESVPSIINGSWVIYMRGFSEEEDIMHEWRIDEWMSSIPRVRLGTTISHILLLYVFFHSYLNTLMHILSLSLVLLCIGKPHDVAYIGAVNQSTGLAYGNLVYY